MDAIEIQDIWHVIRESERSDESCFTHDETSTRVEAPREPQQLQDLFSDMDRAPGRRSIDDTVNSLALPELD